jgi:hypothetical protein
VLLLLAANGIAALLFTRIGLPCGDPREKISCGASDPFSFGRLPALLVLPPLLFVDDVTGLSAAAALLLLAAASGAALLRGAALLFTRVGWVCADPKNEISCGCNGDPPRLAFPPLFFVDGVTGGFAAAVILLLAAASAVALLRGAATLFTRVGWVCADPKNEISCGCNGDPPLLVFSALLFDDDAGESDP